MVPLPHRSGWLGPAVAPIHENHELRIMPRRLWRCRATRHHTRRDDGCPGGRHPASSPTDRRPLMQWQTPTAIDWRFGFEITLYAAAR
jgi:coenzyme PQQ precursor peptide PqqA